MILSKENIYQYVDDYTIWSDFVDEFNIGVRICSPFREDRKPSFGWFEHTSGTILYKDFGTGEIGDVFKFLQQLWDDEEESVLEKVSSHYNLPLIKRPTSFFNLDDSTNNICDSSNTPPKLDRKKVFEHTKIEYRIKVFEQIKHPYFEQFGISEEVLKKHGVHQCEYVYVRYGNVERLFYMYTPKNPCFVYVEPNGYKLYQPLTPNKQEKWRSNFQPGTIECFDLLPTNAEILIITSSRKDVMCIKSLNLDFDLACIAPVSENSYSAILERQHELNRRFKHIIVYTNNDEPGVNASIKLTNKTGWQYMNNPKGEPKDPSDYYKEYGEQKLKQLISEKINQCCTQIQKEKPPF